MCVCVRECVCVYIYIYARARVRVPVYSSAYYTSIHTHAYVCMCVYIYIYGPRILLAATTPHGVQVIAINELLALGFANLGGALYGAVPTQSLGRSRGVGAQTHARGPLNYRAPFETGFAGLIHQLDLGLIKGRLRVDMEARLMVDTGYLSLNLLSVLIWGVLRLGIGAICED